MTYAIEVSITPKVKLHNVDPKGEEGPVTHVYFLVCTTKFKAESRKFPTLVTWTM
jgi:hypothetical protein